MFSLLSNNAAAALAGATLLSLTSVSSALTFTIDEFTGGDSTVRISTSQFSATSVDFVLEITKPVGPSDSDLSGFWGHLADETLIADLAVSEVKFGYNGVFASSLDYAFVNEPNTVENVTNLNGSNNNINGNGNDLGGFDFGFHFAKKNGLDNPAINSVSFRFTNLNGLSESTFANQLFAARLQPLEADPSSSKLSGFSPRVTSVPDSGSTLMLLGLALGGAGTLRRYFGK